ncbi:MAG: hypothetical protein LAT63_16925 [Marinobacter sp.]|nr:hypothetical protein [Marinobacter sp.]
MSELDKHVIDELSNKLDVMNKNLEELKAAAAAPSKVDVTFVGMSIDQMAILHFKLFLSSLPLVATLILIGFGLVYLFG